MDKIRCLAQSCLLSKSPQLNNISTLLLQLISPTNADQLKLFIASSLTNIFTSLHKRAQFDQQTTNFINEKQLTFLSLLLQFVTINKEFEGFIGEVNEISGAGSIVELGKGDSSVWGYVRAGEKVVEVLQEVLKESTEVQIDCLLNVQDIDYEQHAADNPELLADLQTRFKKSFQTLLFSILKDPFLPDATYKTLVDSFPQKIFPKIVSPLHLSQHICHKYSSTPSLQLKISLLSSLFILIGKYNLQFPNFYHQLFTLIQLRNPHNQSVFQVSNSKRVLKMIENSLRSSKIPFNVLVKFIKELINRCLFENTSFVCWVMALSFNLFKKHQLLGNCLNPQSDMYVPEFDVVGSHFLPQIQGLVKKLGGNLGKEDFLDIAEFSTVDLQRALKQQMEGVPEAKILVPMEIENLLG